MKKYIKPNVIIIIVIMLNLFTAGCHSHSGLTLDDMLNSDHQKQFKQKLMAQQDTIDSMAKIYKGKAMIVNTFNDFNGDPKKILLYDKSGYKILDTLAPGDTVKLVDVLPLYGFNETPVPKILLAQNTVVTTKKGVTGVIHYYFIQAFKEELKDKGLETDTL